MDESLNPDPSSRQHKRLQERADQMAKSGRLTDQEAERLCSSDKPDEVEDVIRSIRVRHAGAKLGAAVEDGSVTPEEAERFLDRLRNGEHSAALRAQVRKLRPSGRTPARPRDDDNETGTPSA